MQPAIEVDRLTKRYGTRTVVDDVTFSVAPGSVLCLLGRNGAGKTTTIECIEGFRVADRGAVRILGHDPVAQRAAVIGRMGVMLQEGGAYPSATPREMLGLYARLFPRARPVDEVLSMTGLTDRADARFRTLSGGEKQRSNLALALIGHPEVLFLDEPTAGMDPAVRRSTATLLRRLRDDGAAILLTTHALHEAEQLADAVAIIDGGRILALDTPAGITGSSEAVEVRCVAAVDLDALSARFGVPVRQVGPDRYQLGVGPQRIPEVTAWFAQQQLPVTGVTQVRRSLEDAFLELTGGEA